MDNSDNKKISKSTVIDYGGGGGIGSGGKGVGNGYDKRIMRYLTTLDSKFKQKSSLYYVKSKSQVYSRGFERKKCDVCKKIGVMLKDDEMVCVKCGAVSQNEDYKSVNIPKVTSEENTLSAISQEVLDYIKEFKDKKLNKLIYKDTKIKVAVLWYLISRKKSIENKNREFPEDAIINAIPKMSVPKVAEKQRQKKPKSSRYISNPNNEYDKYKMLVLETFPELKIWERRLPIIPLIEKLRIRDQNVRRKVEKRVRKILDRIYDDKGNNKKIEFQSKARIGFVAAVIYLVIHELRKEDENINFKFYTQEAIGKKCGVENTGTIQKRIKDLKKFNLY